MEHLANFIVKHRKAIGIFFVIATVLSVYLDRFVVLNYDFSQYIPDEESSMVAYHKVEDEFGMNGTSRVMFIDTTLSQAAEYKTIIENVEGVNTVMWLDDYADVYQPVEFIDSELLVQYYKDGCTVMDIMFDEDDYSDSTYYAVHKLKEVLPQDGSVVFMGSAVTSTSIRDNVKSEMVVILAIVIPIVIVILLLTTDSWFEPVIFLTVIGVSILLNKGTNVIFENISYVTYSITAALQLAISMDYSVFILHEFEHQKSLGHEAEEAMRLTLKDGVTAVFASALTTIAGFIALSFMGFSLGKDLGFVFSKGIILSLICVIFLMPYLILTFYPLVEKTRHKSLFPNFTPFAKKVCSHNYIFLLIAIIVIVPMFFAQNANSFKYGAAAVGAGPGTEIYEDEEKVRAVFGNTQFMLALIPNTGYVDAINCANDLEAITVKDVNGNDVKALRYAKTVANTIPVGVPDFFAPQDTLSKFKNENYTRILMAVRSDSESDLAFEILDKVNETMSKYYEDEYYLTGTIPVTVDLKNVVEKDYKLVNLLSILAVLAILLFTFKSIALPVLLIAVIEGAIFINMGIPYLLEQDLIFIGYLIISTIQLGATIDYAILMTENYMVAKETMQKKEAIINALAKSLPSLLTSGGILITCGYAIKGVSSISAVAEMGELIGRGALFSLILVVFVLPQVLYVFDGLIVKTTLKSEYKIRIGSKVYVIGRKTATQSKRAQAIKEANERLIGKVNKRITQRKEKLEKEKLKLDKRNANRLSKAIEKLEELKNKVEKESEEIEKEIK